MFEKDTEKAGRAQRDIASETRSRNAVDELRGALTPLVERLTPEVEPAVIYTPTPRP
jgi:hypothetical protein